MIVSNILIYRALKNTERIETLKRLSATTADPDRTLKMLLLNALVFTILVLPKDLFFIVYTLTNLNEEILDRDTGTTINSALKLLQQCNCIVNIFIYSRLHASFRSKIKRTFSNKWFCRLIYFWWPSLHTTLFQRPSNVHNVHITLNGRWNNVVHQLWWYRMM